MLRFRLTASGDLVVLSDEETVLAEMRRRFPVMGILDGLENGTWLPCEYCAQGWDVEEEYLQIAADRYLGRPRLISETARLRLREVSPWDQSLCQRLCREMGETAFREKEQFWDQGEAGIREYIRSAYVLREAGVWLIEEKETGLCIGMGGLEPSFQGEMELSYGIAEAKRRQGFAEEACRAIIDYGWKKLNLQKIFCFVRADNLPSQRLALKLGFQPASDAACAGGRPYIKRRN